MKGPRWLTPKEIIDQFKAEQARLRARGAGLRVVPPAELAKQGEWKDAMEESRAELEGLPGPSVLTLLMSRANPDGWKLEELLVRIRADLEQKNARLEGDPCKFANAIREANSQIIALLFDAEGIQRNILALLDTLGPDQGPRGSPRVGKPDPS